MTLLSFSSTPLILMAYSYFFFGSFSFDAKEFSCCVIGAPGIEDLLT
jgi:hypothetical protein